jgi:hypothetical protein
MKVAELRAALSEHELDTKGTKPVLVARLKEFFDNEADGKDDIAEPEVEEIEPEAEAGNFSFFKTFGRRNFEIWLKKY